MIQKPTIAISLNDVHIRNNITTLNGLSLEVEVNSCLAILGIPKSGKTALIKALAGLTKIKSGTGYILEYELQDPDILNTPNVGFLHQAANWSGSLTLKEIVHLTSRRFPNTDQHQVIDNLIKIAGLEKKQDTFISDLSVKERQLAGLITLQIQNPQLLILDNPADNLKETDRKDILDFMVNNSHQHKTIFFTTSHLYDVQAIATHVAILHNGAILAQGKKDTILAYPDAAIFRISLIGNTDIVYEYINNLSWIKKLHTRVEGDQTIWILAIEDTDNTSTRFLRAILADRNLRVIQYNLLRPRIDHFLTDLERTMSN